MVGVIMTAIDGMFWMTMFCVCVIGAIVVRNNNNMRPRF